MKKILRNKILNYLKLKKVIFSPFSILVLIIVFILIISLVKHQRVSLQRQTIRVEVVGQNWTDNNKLDVHRPPYWLLENLKIGMKELGPDGRIMSEIIDIEYYEGANSVEHIFLIINLEVVDSFSSGRVTYRGSNIEAGEKIEFHFGRSLLIGQITNTNYIREKLKTEKILVTGVFENISLQAAEKINSGMKIINPFNGNVYASILEKRVYPSSDHIFYKSRDKSVLRLELDNSLRNVEIDIELAVEKHLGKYYFSGNQIVRIGEKIAVVFPDLQLGLMEIKNVSKLDEAE